MYDEAVDNLRVAEQEFIIAQQLLRSDNRKQGKRGH